VLKKEVIKPVKGCACRVCGCTQDDCRQCIEKTGEPCYWVEEDLCSACKDKDPHGCYKPLPGDPIECRSGNDTGANIKAVLPITKQEHDDLLSGRASVDNIVSKAVHRISKEEFERYNQTDGCGNCFSDADPGL
jgi:hypothetical protein